MSSHVLDIFRPLKKWVRKIDRFDSNFDIGYKAGHEFGTDISWKHIAETEPEWLNGYMYGVHDGIKEIFDETYK